MEEEDSSKSPPPCSPTVTIRRNPPRKARATPSSAIPLISPLSSPSPNPNPNQSDHLKVYLRIRPLTIPKSSKFASDSKNVWPRNAKLKATSSRLNKTKRISGEVCVSVNEDRCSVTVSAPMSLQEGNSRRIKSEVYEGFSSVFSSDASQSDVYEEMVKPLVEDFLKGTSGMLAAMGPSGSGKTHTVFGCGRDPGMVPLALRRIFSESESSGTQLSRVFYLSMFEINSEKGKAERMIDLLHDGGDMFMQYSGLKGLQETMVRDVQQAESLIAHGMLKRATAMTNSNSQSSRSQCIINIRSGSEKGDEEVDDKTSSPMLTIVDLAGAEREKKTGNQGARLIESNFINNTSMVFGLCLRSLLEHQKNRNKPLQKHYKNSLLTRYMQDYLEGRKRMMLILTVKPGVEDYLDTSFLLRQASPFTKIKFKNQEEPVIMNCNKRPNQALPRAGQIKKMKFCNSESSLIDEGNTAGRLTQENDEKVVKDGLNKKIEDFSDENLSEIHVLSDELVGLGNQKKSSLEGNCSIGKSEKDRGYQIMQGFSKALWGVLKKFHKKLEVFEAENYQLKENLTKERSRRLDLENELTNEKTRLFNLENELRKMKSQCICCIKSSADLPVSSHDASSNLTHCQIAEYEEVRSEVSSYYLEESEQATNETKSDPSVKDSTVTSTLCSGGGDEHYPQVQTEARSLSYCSALVEETNTISDSSEDAQDEKGYKNTTAVDFYSEQQEVSFSPNYAQDFSYPEDTVVLDLSSVNEEISQLTAAFLNPSHSCDAKNLELERECVSNGSCLTTSLECKSANTFPDDEDLKDARGERIQDYEDLNILGDSKKMELEDESVSNGSDLDTSPASESANSFEECEDLKDGKQGPSQDHEDLNILGDSKQLELEDESVSNGSDLAPSLASESANSSEDCEDLKDVRGQAPQAYEDLNILGDARKLEPADEYVSTESDLATSLESESANSSEDCEDLKDSKGELTQLENGATDSDSTLVKDQTVSGEFQSFTVRSSSESPRKDDILHYVEEKELNHEGVKPNQSTKVLLEGGWAVKNKSKFSPNLASKCNLQQTQKPKRRLLPASTVLLKDMTLFGIQDENDKPKGGRGGKRTPVNDEKNRTKGSISLHNLLTSKLIR